MKFYLIYEKLVSGSKIVYHPRGFFVIEFTKKSVIFLFFEKYFQVKKEFLNNRFNALNTEFIQQITQNSPC